jgi:hypothetical protein
LTLIPTYPGLLDVSLWRQKSSLAAHLVNLTNPMAMKGPCREVIPVGPFQVSIELPPGAKLTAAKLLSTGAPIPTTTQAGRIQATIPSVASHEVLALDLA